VGEANRFPWQPAPKSSDVALQLAQLWNIGFVRCAAGLVRAITLLHEHGLASEAYLPLRSLYDVAASQQYMSLDPANAIRFTGEEATMKQRVLSILGRLNLGDPNELAQLAAEAQEDLDHLARLAPDVVAELSETKYQPFGLGPYDRAKAGPRWLFGHYPTIFAYSSDFVHMNARAVATYLAPATDEGRPRGGGHAALAAEFLLRILYKAAWLLKQQRQDVLNGFAMKLADVLYPEHPRREIVGYLQEGRSTPRA
jgi:hypothetical protein